jgi:hypothetical protein
MLFEVARVDSRGIVARFVYDVNSYFYSTSIFHYAKISNGGL